MSNVRINCFNVVNVSTRTGISADGSKWRELTFRAADGSAVEITGFAASGFKLEILNHDAGADVNAADVARAVETVLILLADVAAPNVNAHLTANECAALQTLTDVATAAIDAGADARAARGNE